MIFWTKNQFSVVKPIFPLNKFSLEIWFLKTFDDFMSLQIQLTRKATFQTRIDLFRSQKPIFKEYWVLLTKQNIFYENILNWKMMENVYFSINWTVCISFCSIPINITPESPWPFPQSNMIYSRPENGFRKI